MWNLISHFLTFAGGMASGVMLMCLMQTGKLADKRMRLIGKLLALPFMLVTGILYLVCKFLVVFSGAVLGILSGIIFLAALVLFFVAGFLPGLAWLMIAFLISPYGLPLAAAWLVGIIGGANSALKDFIFG